MRKDLAKFEYVDLADEEDLEQELQRIQSRLNENRRRVEARASNDPAKKEEVKQLMCRSRWNRIREKPLLLKNSDEEDEVKDWDPSTGGKPIPSRSPNREQPKGIRSTRVGLNQTIHFLKRPDKAYCEICEQETGYFCYQCGKSICSDCRLRIHHLSSAIFP